MHHRHGPCAGRQHLFGQQANVCVRKGGSEGGGRVEEADVGQRLRNLLDLTSKGLPTMVKLVHQTETEAVDPVDAHGKLFETFAYAVQMAEVAVDVKTGRVSVTKITAVQDIGRSINKLNVEGQTQEA